MIGCGRCRFGVWGMMVVVLVLSVVQVTPAQEGILPLPYVIYTADSGYDLQVMDVNSGEIIFTVSEPGHDCALSISPNRQSLVYSQGGGSTHLHHFEFGTTLALPPGANAWWWSPNSQQLAFDRSFDNQNTGARDEGFYVYDVETGQIDELSSQRAMYAQYLDGQWSLMIEVDEGMHITHGDQSYQVFLPENHPGGHRKPSPDGLYVAYTQQTEEPITHLYLTAVTTGETVQVGPEDIFRYFWSPTGRHIAYIPHTQDAIYLYDVDSGTNTRYPHEPGYYYAYGQNSLRFSPDGRYLSYALHTYAGLDPAHYTVNLIDIQTQATQAVISAFDVHYPSPEHTWLSSTLIAYSKDQYGPDFAWPADLWLYDIATQTHIRLTDTPDINESLYCSAG